MLRITPSTPKRTIKILVSGPFGSGKTQFIKTLSEIKPVNTEVVTHAEAKDGKSTTTVGLDYGRFHPEPGTVVHLFGTPGQERFDFMREILGVGANGLVLLIDSTYSESEFEEAREVFDFFQARQTLPTVICFTKQDLPNARPVEQVKEIMAFSNDIPILPTVATQKDSAIQAVHKVITLIDENI